MHMDVWLIPYADVAILQACKWQVWERDMISGKERSAIT